MVQKGIEDKNVLNYFHVISSYQLKIDTPISEKAKNTVMCGRQGIENILDSKDNRIVAIVGPCSIHNAEEAKEYSKCLKELSDKVSDKILVVMRTYFEKPRTAPSWEGFIIDPDLDGMKNVNKGLHLARKILLDISESGLLCATEYLDTSTPQDIGDFVSWAAIGARDVTSTQIRKMASGLSMPVGIKNDLHGDVESAVNGILYARSPNSFKGVNKYGARCIVETKGNRYAHLVLRGGKTPNYDKESIKMAQQLLKEKVLPEVLIIDCSHSNSNKKYERQPEVLEEVIKQRKDGNQGIVGFMLESYIHEGSQKIPACLEGFDRKTLTYGVSVTDGCIGWETTKEIIMNAYKTLKNQPVLVSKVL